MWECGLFPSSIIWIGRPCEEDAFKLSEVERDRQDFKSSGTQGRRKMAFKKIWMEEDEDAFLLAKRDTDLLDDRGRWGCLFKKPACGNAIGSGRAEDDAFKLSEVERDRQDVKMSGTPI